MYNYWFLEFFRHIGNNKVYTGKQDYVIDDGEDDDGGDDEEENDDCE